jgi:hypothetical protein
MIDSALSRLSPGQLCELILADGQRREGAWEPNLPGFRFCDGKGEGIAFHADVEEWWPASIPF